jgi:hypothetical protein
MAFLRKNGALLLIIAVEYLIRQKQLTLTRRYLYTVTVLKFINIQQFNEKNNPAHEKR